MQSRNAFSNPQIHIASDAGAGSLRWALWAWFVCGLAALLICPALRGFNAVVGWLPFWLVVAPLIDLALLRRGWLAATSHAFLVRARRRRRSVPRQARLLARRRVHTTRLLRVATKSDSRLFLATSRLSE